MTKRIEIDELDLLPDATVEEERSLPTLEQLEARERADCARHALNDPRTKQGDRP